MKRINIAFLFIIAVTCGLLFSINSTVLAGNNTTIDLFFTSDVNSYLKPCG